MRQKYINLTGKNGLNSFFDMISDINDDEIKNDPKVPELVQELIKDLPPELTKKEAKKLTEEERVNRNLKILEIKEEINKKFDPKDATDRLFYAIRKENKQIPASYKFMREGAIRSTAFEIAITICKNRLITTKEEKKRQTDFYKMFSQDLAKELKNDLMTLNNKEN